MCAGSRWRRGRPGSPKHIRRKTTPRRRNADRSRCQPGDCSFNSVQFYAFCFLCEATCGVSQAYRYSSREMHARKISALTSSGATAIEYSLIAGFIALAIIAAVGMTGERLVALFASFTSRRCKGSGYDRKPTPITRGLCSRSS